MSAYNPPVDEKIFLLTSVLGFEDESLDAQTLEAVLDEAAKLSSEVLAPLNHSGDKQGCTLKEGRVITPQGFREAYRQYCDGGWNAVPFPEEYGGQGLPWAVAFPVQEMWQGANMSFGLCPLLNQGAVEALIAHGSEEQKEQYLPRLISGDWTGTMNLTEPQAGSDLGLLKTKAEKQKDGTYKIAGQKIWITYGEHDFTENIIHLVLARTTDAPDDVKGISLFIVPKYLEDGTRNDVKCIGLDHKLGIHASPTCVMQFGDEGGATGYLVGEEHQGLKYMFTMMNNARLSVGLQGVAIAERAYQHALAFAKERLQGKSLTSGERVTIDRHADVRRMLLCMKSQITAARLLTYQAAIALDGDKDRADLLTPLVKSWCTDMACEVTSLGIQIHGGMGFIEETGAAQYYRDARILPIYEGTNGIQAADLVFRKVIRDEAKNALAYIGTFHENPYTGALVDTTKSLLIFAQDKNMERLAAASSPYLRAFAMIAAGSLITEAAAKAQKFANDSLKAEMKERAGFYINNILPMAAGYLQAAQTGSEF